MQQIHITIKSFDPQCILLALKHIMNIARVLQIGFFFNSKKKIAIKRIDLPQKKKKFTVIRSPHIDKKSREQFELRHYKSVFIFNIEKKSCAVLFFECLKNSQLYGVELSIDMRSSCFYCI